MVRPPVVTGSPVQQYPPQPIPTQYPPQPIPTQYPPQPMPTQYPPQYPPESIYPPQQILTQYPPQQIPVQYPPQPIPTQYPPPTSPVSLPPTRPPPTLPRAAVYGEQWSSDILDFDLSQDFALSTAICPCVTFGQIAEIVDEGQTSCLLMGMLYMMMIPLVCSCSALGSTYRRKMREKYNLVETPADDCTVHLINPCCALCQEYRELQALGFDPSLGWEANLTQMKHDNTMAAPRSQFMNM